MDVHVDGGPDPTELAAVLAVLAQRDEQVQEPINRWRERRRAALRRTGRQRTAQHTR